MPFVDWRSQFNPGVEATNEDHRFLGLIDGLHTAVRQGKGKDVQGRILSNLIIHVNAQFAAEEDVMRRCRYPWYHDHKTEHRHFAQRVYELQRQLALGQDSIAIETLNTISNWFQHHVAGTDSKLRPFVLKDLMIKPNLK
jgi:hemerythrin